MDIKDIVWGTISQVSNTISWFCIGQLRGIRMNFFKKELSIEELYKITGYIKRK